MSLRSIYFGLDKKAHELSRYLGANQSAKHYYALLKKHKIKIRSLTASQKAEIDSIWGNKGGYDTHVLVYSVTGRFDARICSERLFRTKIELAINNPALKSTWADKGYFDLFFPDVRFPYTIVKNVAGVFYDHDYNILSHEKAKCILSEFSQFIIKPSFDNGFGRGVKLISGQVDYDALFCEYKSNFVVQKVLEQCEPFARLNPTSVNVLRVISLFVNGRVTPIMAALRCGALGSVTDNYITPDGLGMFVIGVNEDGKLKDEAFHSCGRRITKAPNGVDFTGINIPNYEKIKELTTAVHSRMAHFGFVGFDIAIEKNGEPVVMEYNIKSPGVLYYQYVNGPLFGDRTEEIAQMFRNK